MFGLNRVYFGTLNANVYSQKPEQFEQHIFMDTTETHIYGYNPQNYENTDPHVTAQLATSPTMFKRMGSMYFWKLRTNNNTQKHLLWGKHAIRTCGFRACGNRSVSMWSTNGGLTPHLCFFQISLQESLQNCQWYIFWFSSWKIINISTPMTDPWCCYIYGVPWIPSIYPKHVSINIPAPWIRHGTYLSTIHIQHLSSATCWWLFFGLYHAIPSIYWGLSQLMGKSLLTENPVRRDAENSDFEHCWHVLFSTRNGKYPKWACVYGNVYLEIVKHINIKINNSQISL